VGTLLVIYSKSFLFVVEERGRKEGQVLKSTEKFYGIPRLSSKLRGFINFFHSKMSDTNKKEAEGVLF